MLQVRQPATVPAAQPKPVPQPVAPDVPATQDAFAPGMWDDLQLQEPDPDPVAVNPNLEPDSDQSQLEDEDDFTITNRSGIPLRRRVAAEKPKKNILKSVLCMVAIIAILIAGIRFVLGGSNDSIPPEIENFAEDFIIMLADNNIDTVKEFLSPQNTASDAQINELLQSMADVEILGITSRCRYGIVNEEASGYIYSCAVETDQAGRTFTLSILDESETIALVNATVIDETGENAPPFDLNSFAMMTQLNKIVDGGTEIAVYGPLQMVARASILLLIMSLV